MFEKWSKGEGKEAGRRKSGEGEVEERWRRGKGEVEEKQGTERSSEERIMQD